LSTPCFVAFLCCDTARDWKKLEEVFAAVVTSVTAEPALK